MPTFLAYSANLVNLFHMANDVKITPEQILTKAKVGRLKGKPVWHIESKGGWHMLLVEGPGGFAPVGIGSHRAIARHNAEKTEPGIEITEFSKNEGVSEVELKASEAYFVELLQRIRRLWV